jgi:hypothetical protein
MQKQMQNSEEQTLTYPGLIPLVRSTYSSVDLSVLMFVTCFLVTNGISHRVLPTQKSQSGRYGLNDTHVDIEYEKLHTIC